MGDSGEVLSLAELAELLFKGVPIATNTSESFVGVFFVVLCFVGVCVFVSRVSLCYLIVSVVVCFSLCPKRCVCRCFKRLFHTLRVVVPFRRCPRAPTTRQHVCGQRRHHMAGQPRPRTIPGRCRQTRQQHDRGMAVTSVCLCHSVTLSLPLCLCHPVILSLSLSLPVLLLLCCLRCT